MIHNRHRLLIRVDPANAKYWNFSRHAVVLQMMVVGLFSLTSALLNAVPATAHAAPPDAIIETTELIQFKITLIRSAAAMNYLSLHEVRDLKAISPRGVTPLLVEGISWQRKAGIVTRRGIASNPPAVEFAKVVTRVCQSQPSWAGEAVTGSFWSS